MAYAELDYAEITADVACTATTEAAADTIITLPARTYDGSTAIIVEFFCPAWRQSTTTVVAFLPLFQDGSVYGRMWDSRGWVANDELAGFVSRVRITPAPGSRTYSIRGHVGSASTFTVRAGAGGAGTLMPAYLRTIQVG